MFFPGPQGTRQRPHPEGGGGLRGRQPDGTGQPPWEADVRTHQRCSWRPEAPRGIITGAGKGTRPGAGRNTTSSGPETRLGGQEPASTVGWGTARAWASGAQTENYGTTAKCNGLSLTLQRPSRQH